jgi:hypothetical protein
MKTYPIKIITYTGDIIEIVGRPFRFHGINTYKSDKIINAHMEGGRMVPARREVWVEPLVMASHVHEGVYGPEKGFWSVSDLSTGVLIAMKYKDEQSAQIGAMEALESVSEAQYRNERLRHIHTLTAFGHPYPLNNHLTEFGL